MTGVSVAATDVRHHDESVTDGLVLRGCEPIANDDGQPASKQIQQPLVHTIGP
jgi:hypothetical protein